jgi:hypothetical protein
MTHLPSLEASPSFRATALTQDNGALARGRRRGEACHGKRREERSWICV